MDAAWALNLAADLGAACPVCPCQTQRGPVAHWRQHKTYYKFISWEPLTLCLGFVLKAFILKVTHHRAINVLKKKSVYLLNSLILNLISHQKNRIQKQDFKAVPNGLLKVYH